MKKSLFSIFALISLTMTAETGGLVVTDVSIQPGKAATVQVSLDNAGETYRAVFFSLSLPTGVNSKLVNDEGKIELTADKLIRDAFFSVSGYHQTDGSDRFAVINTTTDTETNVPIPSECGPLFTFNIEADATLVPGTILTGTLSDIKLTDVNAEDHLTDNVTFNITVEETRTILDENATSAPATEANANVRVLRTINASEWSTICLPFAMTEEQVKTAFGDDVQIGDFNDYEVSADGEHINVKFNDVTAIEANHPYIIKVGEKVTEFTVDGVDIVQEDDPMVNFGTRRKPRAMVGTYVANTTVENGCLFLNNNKFWYSVGNTKTKGYRAWFDFVDLLPDFEENYAEARITMTFSSEACGISAALNDKGEMINDNAVHDLQGRRVANPGKGVYIVNGKKIIK